MTPTLTLPAAELYQGDALAVLAELDTGSVDAIVTDPPYSSGGRTKADRSARAAVKYTDAKGRRPRSDDFAGEHRDQRGWAYWSALWLGEALRVTVQGGVLAMFWDWRQLPAATDALQAGGWLWRGVLPWVKPDARPQLGRYRQAAEFIVWGTNGDRPIVGPCHPGHWVRPAPRSSNRTHITEKPLAVVADLVAIADPGATVLDPFMGGGTTGVAAVTAGRRFVGIESSWIHFGRAAERISRTLGAHDELVREPAPPPGGIVRELDDSGDELAA